MVAIIVLMLLGFVFIAAPIGYAMDISDGLKATKKPVKERTYKDADAIYDGYAALFSVVGGVLFVLFLI